MKFSYCPQCGTKLTLKVIGDEGLIPYCDTCKRPWFPQSTFATITLVINEFDEVLLINEDRPNYTHPVLIAGYTKEFESLEATVKREVFEEVGQTVHTIIYDKSYPMPARDLVMVGYFAFVNKQEIKISDELEKAFWVSYKEVQALLKPESIALKVFLAYKEKYHE